MVSKIIVSTRGIARLILSCVVVLGLATSIVMGQETTGGISGTVIDASGAAIPGAKVDIEGGTPVRVISTTSNASGIFNVGNLPVGIYTVTASAGGFATMKRTSLAVDLGKVARVDFRMEVGQVTESVVVAADAVMVDTASSASQINVDKSFFDLMPKGRSFYDLVNLAPGARNEGKSGGYQVDGASGSENTFYLDGMEVTNVQTGVLSDQNKVPVEMVQQIQVKNGVMDAQYGGAMGGVVNAVVRSGSNQFHGDVGFYFNNDSLQARPRPTLQFDPTDGDQVRIRNFQNPQDSFSTWNPIVSIGGPIIKNKLFFFSGFMPSRTNTTRTVTFLGDDSTGTFKNKKVQQYMAHKLDFIPFSRGWIFTSLR